MKAFELVKALSPVEQSRCRKFLQSPYFNSDKALLKLFDEFKRISDKEGMEQDVDKERLWKKLASKKPYNDIRFRKFTSDLTKLIEDFLVQESLKQNEVLKAQLLGEEIVRKNLSSFTNTIVRKFRTHSTEGKLRNSDFYLNEFLFGKIYSKFYFEDKRDEIGNLEELSDHLDIFYFSEKLKLLHHAVSRQYSRKIDYQLKYIDQVLTITNSDEIDSPLIRIYNTVIKLYQDPEDTDSYYKLIDLLNQHSDKFTLEELKDDLYMAAQNFCITRMNAKDNHFRRELFELYKKLLDQEILTSDGNIIPWNFRNIAFVGLILGEYEWVERFIHKYESYLPPAQRRNLVVANLALLYHYQKKFDLVIEKLRDVEYNDTAGDLFSKALLLIAYYEQDEFEALESYLSTFQTYLNRHKEIPESRRRSYLDMIKYVRRLNRLLPGDDKQTAKLKTDITNNSVKVPYESWLFEKIAEFEGEPVN